MAKTTKKTTKKTASKKAATTKAQTKSETNEETSDQTPDATQENGLTDEQQKKSDAKDQSEEDVKAKTAEDNAKMKAKTGRTTFGSRFDRYNARGVQFEGGQFSTDDPAVIAKLEAHPAYKSEFWKLAGEAS